MYEEARHDARAMIVGTAIVKYMMRECREGVDVACVGLVTRASWGREKGKGSDGVWPRIRPKCVLGAR